MTRISDKSQKFKSCFLLGNQVSHEVRKSDQCFSVSEQVCKEYARDNDASGSYSRSKPNTNTQAVPGCSYTVLRNGGSSQKIVTFMEYVWMEGNLRKVLKAQKEKDCSSKNPCVCLPGTGIKRQTSGNCESVSKERCKEL